VPERTDKLQNTDPLVFGDYFLYSNCRQRQNGKLRALAPGSMVLFGSKVGGQFVLDTLFVVGEGSRTFARGSSEELGMPTWIDEVLFAPLQASTKSQDDAFRLYLGRTYEEAPEGPFSFVPCRPYHLHHAGFARLAIDLGPRWINRNLAMGAKATAASEREIRNLWDAVVHQVVDGPGLALGVHLDVPPRFTGRL
jgi:hypothetical protein